MTLPKNLHQLFITYFTNRRFTVKVMEFKSEEYPIMLEILKASLWDQYCMFYLPHTLKRVQKYSPQHSQTTPLFYVEASAQSKKSLKIFRSWLSNWRIKENEQKCKHVSFILKTETSPILQLNNVMIPQASEVKYLGIHLDRRFT